MSVRKSTAWSYGAQALSAAIGFVSGVLVARLLPPHVLGTAGMGSAIMGAFAVIASGLGPYLVREEEISPREQSAAFTINAALNFLLGLLVLSIGMVARWWFSAPEIGEVLCLLSISPILAIFEYLPAAMLTRDMRFGALSAVVAGKAVLNGTSLVILAWLGWSYLSPAVAVLISGLFGAIAFSVVGRKYVTLRFSTYNWRDIVKFGAHMVSIGGVSTLAARLSEIIVGRFLGLTALGLYGRASGLATTLWDNAYGTATRVVFAEMSREKREQGTTRRTFLLATRMITAVMWPLLLGIALLSRPIVHLLYGDRWLGAALPLSMLMIGQFVSAAFAMNWELCVLTRRTGWQARVELTRAAAGIAAFSFGALFNVAAAAAGRIFESLVGFVFYRRKMDEMAGTSPGELASAYRETAILTAVAVTPSAVLMVAFRWSAFTPFPAIAAAIGTGAILWVLMLHRLQHPLMGELALLKTRLLRPGRSGARSSRLS